MTHEKVNIKFYSVKSVNNPYGILLVCYISYTATVYSFNTV